MRVFQTLEVKVNRATGRRELVFDANGRPVPHKRWRFTYVDAQGRRRTGTGARTKTETKAIAEHKQVREDRIRMGVCPPPKAHEAAKMRPFAEVTAEYVRWGKAQGGHHGGRWDDEHAAKREAGLKWWGEQLNLDTLADLDGILPRVDEVLRKLQDAGRAGKTLANRVEALAAFCDWCIGHGYLAEDPLRNLKHFDTRPKTTRRALTLEEIGRLFAVAPERRRLIYATTLCSGLRAGELRAVQVKHLDAAQGGLVLEAGWTKNRRPAFQPLPRALVESLTAAAVGKKPDDPLLAVSSHPHRTFECDRKRAEIEKQAFGGKVDFHALRATYATLAEESGATVKEVETLLRHQTPGLAHRAYVKVREDRLPALAEKIGGAVLAHFHDTTEAERRKAGHTHADVTLRATGTYGKTEVVGARGFEPPTPWSQTRCSDQAELRPDR